MILKCFPQDVLPVDDCVLVFAGEALQDWTRGAIKAVVGLLEKQNGAYQTFC